MERKEHLDTPHTDTYKPHADTPFSNWTNHADSPHTDTTTHGDIAHKDALIHADSPHTDSRTHADIPHADYSRRLSSPHGDKVEHADVSHKDAIAHVDTPHTDSFLHYNQPHQDVPATWWSNYPFGHTDTPHTDVPHKDSTEHFNVSHSDTAIHTDIPHQDYSRHTDESHGDWFDHGDKSHVDVITHADIPHSDTRTHTDSPHSDTRTHGDTSHSDSRTHTDVPHSDSVAVHADVPHGDFTNVVPITYKIKDVYISIPTPITVGVSAVIGTEIGVEVPTGIKIEDVARLITVTVSAKGRNTGETYSCKGYFVTVTSRGLLSYQCSITPRKADTYDITVTVDGITRTGIMVVNPHPFKGWMKLDADFEPKTVYFDCKTLKPIPDKIKISYNVSWDAANYDEAFPEFKWVGVIVTKRVGAGPVEKIYGNPNRSGSYSGTTESPLSAPGLTFTGTEIAACLVHTDPKWGPRCITGTEVFKILRPSLIYKDVSIIVGFPRMLITGEKVTVTLDNITQTPSMSACEFKVDEWPEDVKKTLKVEWSWPDIDLGGGEIIPAGKRTFTTTISPECRVLVRATPTEPLPEVKPYFDIEVRCKTTVYTGENVALRISTKGGKSPYEFYVKAEGPTWKSEKEVIIEERTTEYVGIYYHDFHFGLPAGVNEGTGTIYIEVKDADGRVRTRTITVKVLPAIKGVTPGIPPPPLPIERKPRIDVSLSVKPNPPWYPEQVLSIEIQVTAEGKPAKEAQILCKYEVDGKRYERPSVKYPAYMGKIGYWPDEIVVPKEAAGKTLKIWVIASGLDQYLGDYVESTPVVGNVIGISPRKTRIIITMPSGIPLGDEVSICGYLEGFYNNTWTRISNAEVKIYINNNLVGTAKTNEIGVFGKPYKWISEGRHIIKVVYDGEAGKWEPCQSTFEVLVSTQKTKEGYPIQPTIVEYPPPGAAPPSKITTSSSSPGVEPTLPAPGVTTVILKTKPEPPWNINQTITLIADLSENKLPVPNKLIYFYETFENKTKLIGGSYTNNGGIASITHKLPSKEGIVSFSAVYVEKGIVSNTVSGAISKPAIPISTIAIGSAIAGMLGGLIYFFTKRKK